MRRRRYRVFKNTDPLWGYSCRFKGIFQITSTLVDNEQMTWGKRQLSQPLLFTSFSSPASGTSLEHWKQRGDICFPPGREKVEFKYLQFGAVVHYRRVDLEICQMGQAYLQSWKGLKSQPRHKVAGRREYRLPLLKTASSKMLPQKNSFSYSLSQLAVGPRLLFLGDILQLWKMGKGEEPMTF